MKKTEIILYSLFAVGIILKLFKLPMHTLFILGILAILLIYYSAGLINKSRDLYSGLTGIVTVIWLFCLLATLKHFPFLNIIWAVAILSGIVLFIALYKNNKIKTPNSLFCASIIALSVFLKYLPSHFTYYLTNIKFNYEIDRDYNSWDKYSWFLNLAGKQEEAIDANKNALKALQKNMGDPLSPDENNFLALIKKHGLELQNKTWIKYH